MRKKVDIHEVMLHVNRAPAWVSPFVGEAITLIDTSTDDGDAKREWVRSTLIAAAKLHDVKWLPDDIEEGMEAAVIDLVVATVFAIKIKGDPEKRFARKMRRLEKRIEKGRAPELSYWNGDAYVEANENDERSYTAFVDAWGRYDQIVQATESVPIWGKIGAAISQLVTSRDPLAGLATSGLALVAPPDSSDDDDD